MGSDELVKGDEKDADLGDDTSEEGNDVTIDKVDSAAAGSNGEGNNDTIDKVDNAAGLGNRFVQQICVVTASECVDVTGATVINLCESYHCDEVTTNSLSMQFKCQIFIS